MTRWRWLDAAVMRAVHDEQLAEHGGAAGERDPGLFESALARPLHLDAYGAPGAADLAAAYGYGLARNHPFVDGNKRTAFVAMELFLGLNGMDLDVEDAECVEVTLRLAAGGLSEKALAAWLRDRVKPRKRTSRKPTR